MAAVPSRPLPIHEIQADLAARMAESNRLVIRAPTGSGKSTQVPSMLLDEGLAGTGAIVVLQPRRIAARMLARRVAWERGAELGGEVGYQVRFESRCGPRTRIRYETDGVLMRQLLGDPLLEGVNIVVFDEFHERHLYGDLMLGLLRRLQDTTRPDLRLVVMSATLDSRRVAEYLAPCAELRSEGRMFPVRIEYLPRPPDVEGEGPAAAAARECERRLREQAEGHVLIFMPGAYEIRRTLDELRALGLGRDALLLPLHGDLPPQDQDAAVERAAPRKIVVATNVAETSITVDGVTLVIDSGLARKASFDSYRGINTLLVEPISRASADQRAGRAGRTRPGLCVRLWTERDHAARAAHELPEVQRVDLAETVLLLKALGVPDPGAFPWLDAPAPQALRRASDLLGDLGALSPEGEITAMGRRLLAFPAHPRYARMLIAAGARGCVPTVALMAALTQERNLLVRTREEAVRRRRLEVLGEEHASDLDLLVRAWEFARDSGFSTAACREAGIHAVTARQVSHVRDQFLAIARAQGLDTDASAPGEGRRCVLCGFPDRLARSLGRGTTRYEVVHRRRGSLDPESAVRDRPLIVASEIHEIGRVDGEAEVRLALVTAIEPAWLDEEFPGEVAARRQATYDPETARVRVEEQRVFRDLVLPGHRGVEPTDEEACRILAGEVLAGRITLKGWDHAVEQWVVRVNRLAEWCPELGLSPLGDADRRHLVEQVCLGARSGRDVRDRPVWPVVRGWLSAAQQAALDAHAPERIALSNGRTPKVVYDAAHPPHIALRIQELYDVRDAPRIAMGRVRLRVQILAPSQRPVQVTDDLASFWSTHYPAVKRELMRRYPKHEWR